MNQNVSDYKFLSIDSKLFFIPIAIAYLFCYALCQDT